MQKAEEKQELEIRINPAYEALIDRPSQSEYASRKQSMRTDGQLAPGVVNQFGIVLDGHVRYRICKELGIPFWYVAWPDSKGELDDIKYVFTVNAKQRHWTKFQKAEHALRYQPHTTNTISIWSIETLIRIHKLL